MYVEAEISQTEDGELVAEPLTDVLSLKDVEGAEESSLRLTNGGTVTMQKGKFTGVAPANSEELRVRIRIMGHAWECVRNLFPGAQRAVWGRHPAMAGLH